MTLDTIQPVLAAPARAGFRARIEALDWLDVHVFGNPAADKADGLKAQDRLEAVNDALVCRLRARIQAGRFTRAGLRRALRRLAGNDGYDTLDELLDRLLCTDELEPEQREREPEMVFYQPTPARVILDLAEEISPDEVFYDLGSGLGHVVVLVALLTGARAHGIEFEPSYHAYATSSAASLGLTNAHFSNADVREADLAGGTLYFMYTPFRGAMLAIILKRLEAEAPRRLATYGPCTADVAAAGWRLLKAGEPSFFAPPAP
jgi:hypothetical protein